MALELKHNIPKEITKFLDDMDRDGRTGRPLTFTEQRAVDIIRSIWPAMRAMEDKLCKAQLEMANLRLKLENLDETPKETHHHHHYPAPVQPGYFPGWQYDQPYYQPNYYQPWKITCDGTAAGEPGSLSSSGACAGSSYTEPK